MKLGGKGFLLFAKLQPDTPVAVNASLEQVGAR